MAPLADHPGRARRLAGFYGRLVSVALLPVLLGALFVHAPNGGWDYPAFLAVTCFADALIGEGTFAVRPVHLPAVIAVLHLARTAESSSRSARRGTAATSG